MDTKPHFLVYTSDREHGGINVLGIFDNLEDAYACYTERYQSPDERYWNICFIEKWINNIKEDIK